MYTKVPSTDPAVVLDAIRSNTVSSLQASTFGEGLELPEKVLEKTGLAIAKVVKKLPKSKALAKVEFDRKVAVILHKSLALSPVAASHPGFWAYFAARYGSHGAIARFGTKALVDVPPSRLSGGPKDVYRRLWLRAEVSHDPAAKDPYALTALGGEDFWVGIIERTLSRSRQLVRAIVTALFTSDTPAAMADHRAALKWIIEVQPVRALDLLDAGQAKAMAKEALSIARKVTAPPSSRKRLTLAPKGRSRTRS